MESTEQRPDDQANHLAEYLREAEFLIKAVAKVRNVHFCEPPPDQPMAIAIIRER